MSNIKRDLETRCELAMMGKCVKVNSNDEVQAMTDYILNVLGKKGLYEDLDIISDRIQRYSDKNEVKYMVCNTLMGGQFQCITYLVDTNEEEEPKPLETDYCTGYPCSFCYVFNIDGDDMSEFGDCFFEKRDDNFYHRVS